ncbi:hypothetical protein L7F22_027583 [Adiantum nelumboides]|nr:hypothetical protein [Adiantum nelumboides]
MAGSSNRGNARLDSDLDFCDDLGSSLGSQDLKALDDEIQLVSSNHKRVQSQDSSSNPLVAQDGGLGSRKKSKEEGSKSLTMNDGTPSNRVGSSSINLVGSTSNSTSTSKNVEPSKKRPRPSESEPSENDSSISNISNKKRVQSNSRSNSPKDVINIASSDSEKDLTPEKSRTTPSNRKNGKTLGLSKTASSNSIMLDFSDSGSGSKKDKGKGRQSTSPGKQRQGKLNFVRVPSQKEINLANAAASASTSKSKDPSIRKPHPQNDDDQLQPQPQNEDQNQQENQPHFDEIDEFGFDNMDDFDYPQIDDNQQPQWDDQYDEEEEGNGLDFEISPERVGRKLLTLNDMDPERRRGYLNQLKCDSGSGRGGNAGSKASRAKAWESTWDEREEEETVESLRMDLRLELQTRRSKLLGEPMGTSRERVSGLEEVEEEVEDRRHHQHREAGRLERNRKEEMKVA